MKWGNFVHIIAMNDSIWQEYDLYYISFNNGLLVKI